MESQPSTLNLVPLEAGLLHNSKFTENARLTQNILSMVTSLLHSLIASEVFGNMMTLSNQCRKLWTRNQAVSNHSSMTPNPRRKTLVLDMDETLIHSRLQENSKLPAPLRINAPFENIDYTYYVYDRPDVYEFLATVSQWYDLVVFTASLPNYADPIIDWLEGEVRARYPLIKSVIKGRYYRQHCIYYSGVYTKDLTQIKDDLRDIALLDNSDFSFLVNPENAIPIRSWTNKDVKDTALRDLLVFLNALSHVEDVRSVLKFRTTRLNKYTDYE